MGLATAEAAFLILGGLVLVEALGLRGAGLTAAAFALVT